MLSEKRQITQYYVKQDPTFFFFNKCFDCALQHVGS